jgi:hypothetical protein
MSQGIDHLLWLLAKENLKNPRGLDNYFLQIDFLFLDK